MLQEDSFDAPLLRVLWQLPRAVEEESHNPIGPTALVPSDCWLADHHAHA